LSTRNVINRELAMLTPPFFFAPPFTMRQMISTSAFFSVANLPYLYAENSLRVKYAVR